MNLYPKFPPNEVAGKSVTNNKVYQTTRSVLLEHSLSEILLPQPGCDPDICAGGHGSVIARNRLSDVRMRPADAQIPGCQLHLSGYPVLRRAYLAHRPVDCAGDILAAEGKESQFPLPCEVVFCFIYLRDEGK